MEFGGRYLLSAGREAVWRALNDTAVLKASIPGCRRIDWTSPTTLDLDIEVNFGPIKPVFAGTLELSDIHVAERYVLSGRGKGGLLGLAHGSATITLADAPGGTELAFTATGGASSRIMSLGRAIIGNSAQRIIDGFFERFATAMGTTISVLDPAPEI